MAAPLPRRARAPSSPFLRPGFLPHPFHRTDLQPRRSSRGAASGNGSASYKSVIVLRCSAAILPGANDAEVPGSATSFELSYNGGAGSELRPLMESVLDFLTGSRWRSAVVGCGTAAGGAAQSGEHKRSWLLIGDDRTTHV